MNPKISRFSINKHLFLLKLHSCSFKQATLLCFKPTYVNEGIQSSHRGTSSLQLHGTAALLALSPRRRWGEEEEDQIQIRKEKTGRI